MWCLVFVLFEVFPVLALLVYGFLCLLSLVLCCVLLLFACVGMMCLFVVCCVV